MTMTALSIIDRLEIAMLEAELRPITDADHDTAEDTLRDGRWADLPLCGCGATAAIPGAGYSGDAGGGVLTDTCKRCGHCHTIRIDGEWWHAPPGTTWEAIARLAERGEL